MPHVKGGAIMGKCGKECEVYSRVVGYYRPVQRWNEGKKEEFICASKTALLFALPSGRDRLEYSEERALKRDLRKRGEEVGRKVGK